MHVSLHINSLCFFAKHVGGNKSINVREEHMNNVCRFICLLIYLFHLSIHSNGTHSCTDATSPENVGNCSDWPSYTIRKSAGTCGSSPRRKSLERRSSVRGEGEIGRERERKKREKAKEEGSKEGKVESVSQERFIARGQSARRTGLFQEQSVNPH